jgi:diketogulonate reductase-like aldo/keto reductase
MMMATQPHTTLNNEIQMPLLGLGVYDMYEAEAKAAVLKALEVGYRLIDTAAAYGNEKDIGAAIRESDIARNEIFVTTKVANPDQGYDSTMKAFDTSMQKLNIDYIDLYLMHWPIKGKRKDTWKALEKLCTDKSVRAIGVANHLIPFLYELETYATITPAVNQIEFTPWLFVKDVLAFCKEKNIQLQSYSPITRAKKFDDERLQQLCKKYDKSPAQIILRWNIEHSVSTIPKSANPARIEENFNIFDFSLSKEDVAVIDSFNEGFRICENPMDMW